MVPKHENEITFLYEDDILYIKIIGTVAIDDLIGMIEKGAEYFSSDKNAFTILDYSESILNFELSYVTTDMSKAINTIKTFILKYKHLKAAVIDNDPKNMAFHNMFKSLTNDLDNFNHEIFDNFEEGLKFLTSEEGIN